MNVFNTLNIKQVRGRTIKQMSSCCMSWFIKRIFVNQAIHSVFKWLHSCTQLLQFNFLSSSKLFTSKNVFCDLNYVVTAPQIVKNTEHWNFKNTVSEPNLGLIKSTTINIVWLVSSEHTRLPWLEFTGNRTFWQLWPWALDTHLDHNCAISEMRNWDSLCLAPTVGLSVCMSMFEIQTLSLWKRRIRE